MPPSAYSPRPQKPLHGHRPQSDRRPGRGIDHARLGGGGHPRAGSAQIQGDNPDAVEQRILELIRGNQQASVPISDLMSFPVHTVTAETRMEEVALMLRTQGITGIPVLNGERVVGMISRRDFRKMRKESQIKAPVRAFMATAVLTIAPDKSPTQAAQLMVQHDVGRLPVVDNGRVIASSPARTSCAIFTICCRIDHRLGRGES